MWQLWIGQTPAGFSSCSLSCLLLADLHIILIYEYVRFLWCVAFHHSGVVKGLGWPVSSENCVAFILNTSDRHSVTCSVTQCLSAWFAHSLVKHVKDRILLDGLEAETTLSDHQGQQGVIYVAQSISLHDAIVATDVMVPKCNMLSAVRVRTHLK